MDCFVSDDLKQIEIDDNYWIKVPNELSYEQAITIFTAYESGENMSLIINCVKEWNLTDADGKIAKICPANIKKLRLEMGGKISELVNSYVTSQLSKKKEKIESKN